MQESSRDMEMQRKYGLLDQSQYIDTSTTLGLQEAHSLENQFLSQNKLDNLLTGK